MKHIHSNTQNKGSHAIDTTFVLFFLAVEFGRTFSGFDLVSALTATTLMSFIVLPYFLPSTGEKPAFSMWLMGRAAIALFAMGVGWLFGLGIGTTMPAAFAYLPMTLLIVTAMASSILQFYGFLALSTARK